jgi:hypothetical protein
MICHKVPMLAYRPRDSLLGRQELTRTPPKSCQPAWQADWLIPQQFLSEADKRRYELFSTSTAKKVATFFPFLVSYT